MFASKLLPATVGLALAAGHFRGLPAADKHWDGSSGQDFNTPANWTPSGVPGSADDAFIQLDSAFVRISSAARVENLTLSNGAWMEIDDANLIVDSVLMLDKTNSSSVRLFVRETPSTFDLSTGYLVLRGGAELIMTNCDIGVTQNVAINAGSILSGFGTITLPSGAGTKLANSGTIAPTGNAQLVLLSGATGNIDLDGASNSGQVDITSGTSSLAVAGPLNDAFDGTLTIGDGNFAVFGRGWTLGTQGQLFLNGGADEPARLYGSTVHSSPFDAQGHIDVSGIAEISADTTFRSTADVSVAAGARLELSQEAEFRGGSFVGAGEIELNCPTEVVSPTTIGVATFDLDGASGNTAIAISPGGSLTINATSLGSVGNVFTGSLEIASGGLLVVNTPGSWTLGGTVNLGSPGGAMATSLAGQDVRLAAATSVAGPTEIAAKATIVGTITTTDAAARLQLGGSRTHQLLGGSIAGPGRLDIAGGASLAGFGTISSTIDTQIGSQLLAQDGVLSIAGPIAQAGVLGTADVTGELHFPHNWNSTGVTELRLLGGSVTGATFTNATLVSGFGTLAPSALDNEGIIQAAAGQTLVLATPYLDYDGISSTGTLRTAGGTLHALNHAGPIGFGGTLDIDGGEFRVDRSGGFRVISGAMVAFGPDGGSLHAAAAGGELVFHSGASLHVTGNTATLRAQSIDLHDNSAVTVDGPLVLEGVTSIDALANVTGSSFIELAPGSLLASPANLPIHLVSYGTLWPGYSTGTLGLGSYEQASMGTLRIELGGTLPGTSHDLLDVVGGATLDGALEIRLVAGFVPTAGQVFHVIECDWLTGSFATLVNQEFGAGAGQFLHPLYGADHVSLYVPLPGDANLDGHVSGADYTIWADNFGFGATWAQGDFSGDGQVTGADFTLWADAFGQSVSLSPPAEGATVPEPTGLGLSLAGILTLLAGWARRIRHFGVPVTSLKFLYHSIMKARVGEHPLCCWSGEGA